MYNKLFTKILDSTIWLESDATRLVWVTFIAIMDEDGFVALSSVGNVAARARVSIEAAEEAIRTLESPDKADPDQDHEGRRIERVPSGWMVLNASKYRDIIKRETARAQTRARVARHRMKKKGNADVTHGNEKVTTSVSDAVAVAVANANAGAEVQTPSRAVALPAWIDRDTWTAWIKVRPSRARTAEAQMAAIRKLEKFRAAGHDANEIVATSLANGWQGLFEPDSKTARGARAGGVAEANRAAAEEFVRRGERQEKEVKGDS